MIIRPETDADIATIRALTKAAFGKTPHTSGTEHLIVDALREAGDLFLSLVAEDAGEIVGHVAISPVTISDGTPAWYGLGPISVTPERQLKGIGSKLMNRVLGDLRKSGAAGCVLLGDPGYYSRFGFKPDAGLVLPDIPPPYFQVISFGSAIPAGTVRYAEGFDAKG